MHQGHSPVPGALGRGHTVRCSQSVQPGGCGMRWTACIAHRAQGTAVEGFKLRGVSALSWAAGIRCGKPVLHLPVHDTGLQVLTLQMLRFGWRRGLPAAPYHLLRRSVAAPAWRSIQSRSSRKFMCGAISARVGGVSAPARLQLKLKDIYLYIYRSHAS